MSRNKLIHFNYVMRHLFFHSLLFVLFFLLSLCPCYSMDSEASEIDRRQEQQVCSFSTDHVEVLAEPLSDFLKILPLSDRSSLTRVNKNLRTVFLPILFENFCEKSQVFFNQLPPLGCIKNHYLCNLRAFISDLKEMDRLDMFLNGVNLERYEKYEVFNELKLIFEPFVIEMVEYAQRFHTSLYFHKRNGDVAVKALLERRSLFMKSLSCSRKVDNFISAQCQDPFVEAFFAILFLRVR